MLRETETRGSEKSPFDTLAEAYDAWFDAEGRLIFASEAGAFNRFCPRFPGHGWKWVWAVAMDMAGAAAGGNWL